MEQVSDLGASYAGNAIFHQTLLDSGDIFLPKPFVPNELVRRVRTILDQWIFT